MARKRVDTDVLISWNDVSGALATIGGIDRDVQKIEIEMQQKIDAAKAAAAEASQPLLEQKARIEAQVAAFADAHRDDLGDRKSKTLYFGKVGYRKSSKVILPRAAAKRAEVVIRLRARGMHDCIIVKPEAIDKDVLKKYPEKEIADVGARLDVKDAFWYEIDKEHLDEK